MSEGARYILAKKIARGGMAEIYLGKQVGEDGFQRLCAIKRILPHYAQDQEFIQMFRDEAHICKRLQHANIVRVEGFEEVENSYAIIMEFVDGSDLRTLLHAVEQAKKKLPIPMACFIVAEAARGLHFAHTKVDEITNQPLGIVHRDISPQNILVSFEGEVKVTDFGIADAESKLTETRPGIVKGKYSYMSPEQISAKDVDARSDVFALNIVLWEMLAMRRLFQGENEVDTIQRVKNCRIEPELKSLAPDVDDELDLIVKKGLAKDVKKRHKSAGELEKDLRRFMSRKYPEFTPEDLGSFLKKTMETRRSETQAEIKKTLTETNLKPPVSRNKAPIKKSGVDLSIDAGINGGPLLAVKRSSPVTSVGSTPSPGGSATRGGASALHHPARTNTGMSRLTPGGQGSNAGMPMPRIASHPQRYWLFGGIVAVICILGFFVVKQTAKARPSQLLIRTSPALVKVKIDGADVGKGRYLKASTAAPLRINLKPGDHVITVSREGYEPYRQVFTLDPGMSLSKDDIVLKERGKLAAVRIQSKQPEHPIRVDINDGYFVGQIGGSAAITKLEPDLLVDRVYSARIQLGQGEKDFVCRFTAKSMKWRAPTEILIDRKTRKCTVTEP